MATKKISELTELTSPAGTEELIVNAGGTSKKVQIDNLPSAATEGSAVLSTGETGGVKFLREDGDGTSSWQSDNNTTYSVGDGGLTEINFTSADNSKLDGIATSANNYTHPTGAGNLHVPTGGTVGQVLTNTASGTGTWQAAAGGGGASAINDLTDGYNDASSVGLGTGALANDDGTSNNNTAVGTNALNANTTGAKNTASGYDALQVNTTGGNNTAIGYKCMQLNTTGVQNVSVGMDSLKSNTTGIRNTAIGVHTLNASTGNKNTASGYYALARTTSGEYNTGHGAYALYTNTTGSSNTASGYKAISSSATVSNEHTLGDSSVNNLRCNDTSISSLSDQRDKAEITDLPEEAGLSLINSLRPVTYFWDRREWYDDGITDGSKIKRDYRSWKANSGLRQGFIAQEVETAITGIKCLEDSQIVNGTVDKKEFAPQHLLTNAIKAIQQLSSENEALKIRLTALENA